MQTNHRSRRKRGFSLVELLIVIAVIGVIAAIAVVTLSNTDGNSRVAAAKAQAQRIASTFCAGQAAGAPGFAVVNSVDAAINAVATGSAGAGVNRTSYFQMPGVSASMDQGKPPAQQARNYLRWESGLLAYDASGGGGGGNQYSNWDEWFAALNAAMSAWQQSHPGHTFQEFLAFHQSWTTANPPPGGGMA